MLTRRGLITGLASLLAAPAVVRASSLMPVKALPPEYTHEVWTIHKDWEPHQIIRMTYRVVVPTAEEYAAPAAAR